MHLHMRTCICMQLDICPSIPRCARARSGWVRYEHNGSCRHAHVSACTSDCAPCGRMPTRMELKSGCIARQHLALHAHGMPVHGVRWQTRVQTARSQPCRWGTEAQSAADVGTSRQWGNALRTCLRSPRRNQQKQGAGGSCTRTYPCRGLLPTPQEPKALNSQLKQQRNKNSHAQQRHIRNRCCSEFGFVCRRLWVSV